MTNQQKSIEKIRNDFRRLASFAFLYTETKNDMVLKCRTSCSKIFAKMSNKETTIIWDMRMIDFLKNILLGVLQFEKDVIIHERKIKGHNHIESTILTCISERLLNPGIVNIHLSYSIIFGSESHFYHSFPALTKHSTEIDKTNDWDEYLFTVFEEFILQHEIAHVEIRLQGSELCFDKKALDQLAATDKLIRQRSSELKKHDDSPNKYILRLFEGYESVFLKKSLFEEVLADAIALNKTLDNFINSSQKYDLPESLSIWILARSLIFGLTATRLLSLVDIFILAKDSEAFEKQLIQHTDVFNSRLLYLEHLLKYAIISLTPENGDPSQDFQFDRITNIVSKNITVFIKVENEFKAKYLGGIFKRYESNEVLLNFFNRHTDEQIVEICARKLGWFNIKPSAT